MEDSRFDRMTRALGALTTRRVTFGALLAGALGFHGLADVMAEKAKKHQRGPKGSGGKGGNGKRRGKGVGKTKRQNDDHQAHANTVGTAAKKKKKKKCPPCKKLQQGKCKGTLPDGTPCSGGTCQAGSCRPTSTNTSCATAASCPAPPSAQRCAEATCFAGTCGFGPKPANTVCRPAAGECDVAEVCDGLSLNCPADHFVPNNSACSTGTCQNGACAASCTTPDSCPPPPASLSCAVATCIAGKCGIGPKPGNTVCRAATGECDLAATCNGTALSCPANPFKPANTQCANDGNICTRDVCDGVSANCTHPPEPLGTPCTSDGQPICTQDICNGSGTCTHPPVTNGTNCGTGQQCCNGTCCGAGEGCKFGTTCCLGTGRSCSSTVPCCGSCVLGLCI